MAFPVMMAAGAAIGTGMDFLGQRRARRRQERLLKEIRGLTDQNLATSRDAFARAFPHLQGAYDNFAKYSAQALASNTQAGATAARRVGAQAKIGSDAATAQLRRRGLASTTNVAGAQAAVTRAAGDAYGSIGEDVGRTNAGILMNTGQGLMAGGQMLGGAVIDQGQREVAIRNMLGQTLANTDVSAQGGAAAGLGMLGGMGDYLRGAWSNTVASPGASGITPRPAGGYGKATHLPQVALGF
jgi:hypothetical protein